MRFVRDAIANAIDKQKASAEKRGRTNHEKFTIGDKEYYRQQAFKTRLSLTLEETNLWQGLLAHSM